MAFGLSNKRFSPIGIDFGADSVKLLQIVASDPPQLVAAAAMPIPESARSDPNARHAFLEEALRQMMRTHPFKGRKVICSIPAFQMLLHQLEIPKGEPHEFEEQVGIVLRQRLNLDPSRMVVRHYPVELVVRDGTQRQEVICLAIGRDKVMRYLDTARRAKLDVIGMHAEPITIIRAFGHLYRSAADKARTTCFIDMGGATTKVVIAHGEQMMFAKAIHAAGDHLTRDRAKDERLTFDEARALRMRECGHASAATSAAHETSPPAQDHDDAQTSFSIASTGSGTAAMAAQAAAVQAAPSASRSRHTPVIHQNETIDSIIDELQLCVRYHQSLFPDRPIEKLVFLGGESHHVNNCQRIARALRIGAQLGDPLARMVRLNQLGEPTGVDMRQPQPGWAVPLGLCLSEANL